MIVDIIPIGNSRGIRIPAALLEQCSFGDSAQINIVQNKLIVSPITTHRKGWEAAFKKMASKKDDVLEDLPATQFDEAEWTW